MSKLLILVKTVSEMRQELHSIIPHDLQNEEHRWRLPNVSALHAGSELHHASTVTGLCFKEESTAQLKQTAGVAMLIKEFTRWHNAVCIKGAATRGFSLSMREDQRENIAADPALFCDTADHMVSNQILVFN